jgi:hypothetical protein
LNKGVEETQLQSGTSLTDLELRILEFERHWWRHAGTKDAAIQAEFKLSARDYFQLLNDLIDREDALVASPLLVKRLRRLREARVAARSK